jgi:hypothetical protein
MVEWRAVRGHQGYEVSSDGQVRNARTGRVLVSRRDRDGINWVRLGPGRRRRPRSVLRLTCEGFHGPRPSAAHHAVRLDLKQGDMADNLRWMTRAEQERVRARRDPRAARARQVLALKPKGKPGRSLAAEVAAAVGLSANYVRQLWNRRRGRNVGAPSRADVEDARLAMGVT